MITDQDKFQFWTIISRDKEGKLCESLALPSTWNDMIMLLKMAEDAGEEIISITKNNTPHIYNQYFKK